MSTCIRGSSSPAGPLLATKLFIPPVRPGLVARPRLIEQLNGGMHRSVTLISAPAGFGKSTLLSEWIGHGERLEPARRVAWLSLDEGDNDPVCFLSYVVAALQTIDERLGQPVTGLLGAPHLPPVELLATTLVNDIAATRTPFVLVLDDYHAIHLPWIHQAIEFLIANQPPQMHLVLATRQDPPWPLARLRVRDQLTEIREKDLRFTAEEAAAFISTALGFTLDSDSISTLDARTEGWAAGLQLAALSLQSRPAEGIAEFVAAFGGSHRHVVDYLAGEVLAQQPAEIREFLRQTAVLDRFTAPLCDAVTGRDNSARLLRQLEQANLFVIPLDDRREWSRYHRLFADFLRTGPDPECQGALHLKAAHWLSAHDLLPEAVKHALASRDVNEAARTIILAAEQAFRNAAFTTLLGWLDALPDDVVRADDRLATYKGLLLFLAGRCALAAEYAAAAERALPPEAARDRRGRLHCFQAHIALFQGSLDAAIDHSRQALDALDAGDPLFRSLALNLLGQALEWKGDVAGAIEVYRAGAPAGLQAGNQVGAMATLVNLALALNEQGRLREAVALCRQVVEEHAVQSPLAPPLAEGLYVAWGLLSYEANDLGLARKQAQRALELCEQAGIADGISWARFVQAQVQMANGELEAVRETIREARRFAARRNLEPTHEARFGALEALADLRSGDLASAACWAERSRLDALDALDTARYWQATVHFTCVRVLLAQGRLEQAGMTLDAVERSTREGDRRRTLLTVHLLRALVERALGRPKEAQARVEAALRLAAPEGYRRAFVDEGQRLAALLPAARHAAPAFVDGLLQSFQDEAGLKGARHQIPSLREPLNDREREILRLIAAGRSNPEIAQLLSLSPNTVKWHVKNLYGKLQVSSRVEAAARAAEPDLM